MAFRNSVVRSNYFPLGIETIILPARTMQGKARPPDEGKQHMPYIILVYLAIFFLSDDKKGTHRL